MRFGLRWRVDDRQQREVNDDLVAAVNTVGQFFSSGQGAPSHTPPGPEIYFEEDGPGVHIFNGSWTAL